MAAEFDEEFVQYQCKPCGPQAEGKAIDSEGAQDCNDGCCDEEDPFVEPPESTVANDGEEDEVTPASAGEQTEQEEIDSSPHEDSASPQKGKRKLTSTTSSRLTELARAKPKTEAAAPSPVVPVKRPEKTPKTNRPSLILRLRPKNLEQAWAAFEASGFQEAPKFEYSYSDETVTKYFEENNNVCFELLPEAKRILQKVEDEFGGPEAFMQHLYGERKISPEELRDIIWDYLKDHNIEDKVDIKLVDSMLSAANVCKPGADEKYVVNIANGPISWNMVQGICDHEVGTHLLRMMNDEHQVWHGIRDRYKLANPWTTEEGFATLNTYQSMPTKLMYPQALRYYAVCRGAQCGFVELFHELMGHTQNQPKRCWQMCCRIKRGMIDTSLPGAFYLDQAYFKGAVEILRHLDEVDFGRLYGGQIALKDMDKVHFLLRKEVVRLPRFLNSAETLKTYKAHCRQLIKANGIEAAAETVVKHVFIRTAHEFFKPVKPKVQLNATITIGDSGVNGKDSRAASVGARPLDAERLADLARPRPIVVAETEVAATPPIKMRELDHTRVLELALPRRRAESEAPEARAVNMSRSLNLARLEDLAKPRVPQAETETDFTDFKAANVEKKSLDPRRLLELAVPRKSPDELVSEPAKPAHAARKRRSSRARRRRKTLQSSDDACAASMLGASGNSEVLDDEATPPASEPCDTPRTVDEARLVELATPRKHSAEVEYYMPCKSTPKAGGRRKRSKCRILAMVQNQKDDAVQLGMRDDEVSDSEIDKIVSDENLPRLQHSINELEECKRQFQDPVNSQEPRPSQHGRDASEECQQETQDVVNSQEPIAEPTQELRPEPKLHNLQKSQHGRDTLEECKLAFQDPINSQVLSAMPRQELRLEPKLRKRAVARAQSLGAVSGYHVNATDARPYLPYDDLEMGGYVQPSRCRRQVPIGLPRGAAAAVATAAIKGGAGGKGGPTWQAVPIKIMQFDFCGL